MKRTDYLKRGRLLAVMAYIGWAVVIIFLGFCVTHTFNDSPTVTHICSYISAVVWLVAGWRSEKAITKHYAEMQAQDDERRKESYKDEL